MQYGLWSIYAEFKGGFAEALSNIIAESGFSKKELASRLNVHASAISHWLNSRRLPDLVTVYALAKILSLDNKMRSELVVLWHLCLLSDHLKLYLDSVLQENDMDAARQAFVDLLQQNWGDLFSNEWQELYISMVQPDVYQAMKLKAEEERNVIRVSANEHIAMLERMLADCLRRLR